MLCCQPFSVARRIVGSPSTRNNLGAATAGVSTSGARNNRDGGNWAQSVDKIDKAIYSKQRDSLLLLLPSYCYC